MSEAILRYHCRHCGKQFDGDTVTEDEAMKILQGLTIWSRYYTRLAFVVHQHCGHNQKGLADIVGYISRKEVDK